MTFSAAARSASSGGTDLGRRRPQQAAQAEGEQDDGRADARAQEAGGLGAERELPPQVGRVLDVLEGKEAQEHRGEDDGEHGRHPAGEKGVAKNAARRSNRARAGQRARSSRPSTAASS